MIRRKDRPRLEVREAFEPTRLSRQCLIIAYTCLVAIRRVNIGKPKNNHQEPAVGPVRKGGRRHV